MMSPSGRGRSPRASGARDGDDGRARGAAVRLRVARARRSRARRRRDRFLAFDARARRRRVARRRGTIAIDCAIAPALATTTWGRA